MSKFPYDGYHFYHGTSTIFLDSIRKTGLGGINPNIDFKNLDVLKHLYNLVKAEKIKDDALTTIEDSLKATVAQTDLILLDGERLNFRHDGIYVAASHLRAAIYASTNKYGSEILEKCIILLQVLERHRIEPAIPVEIDIFGVKRYIHAKPKPIVIQVLNVADNDLEKEDGKTAPEALAFLRNIIPTLPEKAKFEFLQFCNFKLLKPVPPEKLRFFELDYEGSPRTGNFQIYLSKI